MDKGTHFHKCDLQVHTPRDRQWHGPNCVTEDERDDYATSLVAACRSKGLGAIAITDHHDMAFVRHVRKAALEEVDEDGAAVRASQRLVVFPGIELTLAVPCQAILLLDADFEDNRFDAVLTALAIDPAADSDAKTCETLRLEAIQSLHLLKQKLDEQIWLRDRYVILPNVSGEGKSSLLRTGMMAKYKEMPWVGGYVDGSLGALKAGPLSILAGRDSNWGNKKIACIQTSDNRDHSHENLGKHFSWIKWATPTAEALRQAFLAQESRISQDTAPELPSVFITNVNASNSHFLGPIDLDFNRQYNCLIGGRGTGKSTILEYIRWALCDQPPLSNDDTAPNYQLRRSRLIAATLTPFASTVDIGVNVNGVQYAIRRDSKTSSIIIKIGRDEWRSCNEDEVRTLLPIQAYSQKQLSDVSVRIDELTRFITAPIRSQLSAISRRIEERAAKLRQTYASRKRLKTVAAEIARRDLEIASLAQQSDAIKNSLTGLAANDQATLAQGKYYDQANRLVEGWKSQINRIRTTAQQLSEIIDEEAMEVEVIPEGLPEQAMLQAAKTHLDNFLRDANASLKLIATKAFDAAGSFATSEESANPFIDWHKTYTEFRTGYIAALAQSSSHAEKLQSLQRVEEQLATQQSEIQQLQEESRTLKAADEVYDKERKGWAEACAERDLLMEEQCRLLTSNSQQAIRATIRRFADASSFVSRLRQSASGSNVRREKLEGIGEYILSGLDARERFENILLELELLADFSSEADGLAKRPTTPSLTAAGLSAADLSKLSQALNSDSWLELSLLEVSSEPIFEYRARDGDYIPFKNASAGQQATALLKTLLNQSGPPLLIDQPEEDLDNPVMQEIVEQIWASKKKRQIIFVSHNANLVVNGDAELVVWCDYRRAGDQSGGKVAGEGAMDIPGVREAIKKIMEGGEAAFKLRREKYGF